MKSREDDGATANGLRVELKYCERCGGLWLRPAGGEQRYCVACAREMAKLPTISRDRKNARLSEGPRWMGDDLETEGEEDDELDLQAAGGAA